MATKEFVGPVDCLGAALPDEEYFLLLARDPLAAGLTMIWASLRIGDVEAAFANFRALCEPSLVEFYVRNPDTAKSEEAVEVAQRMVAWRESNLRAGENGQPSWKSSRAAGVERFVVEYAERRPDGPVIVRRGLDEWPHWLADLRPRPAIDGPVEGPFTSEPDEETQGDMS